MSDIKKRTGKTGTTYQVRYPSMATKSGYAFKTMKEARAFLESGDILDRTRAVDLSVRTVPQAIDRWLRICEKEGTRRAIRRYQDARQLPVSGYLDRATAVRLMADTFLR